MKLSDEAVTIYRDTVYSSYYARACKIFPDHKLIAISLWIPEYFGGSIMRELNPPEYLLRDYKQGLCDKYEYEKVYNSIVLSKLDPFKIYDEIKGKVILCYCGKDQFCHRHLVTKWLKNYIKEEKIYGEI